MSDYHGRLGFEDSSIEDAVLFAINSDFFVTGSLRFAGSPNVVTWVNSHMTRQYDLTVTDQSWGPMAGLTVNLEKADGSTAAQGVTDANGEVRLGLVLDGSTYDSSWAVAVANGSCTRRVGAVRLSTQTPLFVNWVR